MRVVPRLGSGIPIIGRADELSRLRAAFARALQARAAGVLLAGDAGVGKTRVLTELAEHAATNGALVLTGRCIDIKEGGLPYLPFAEALATLTATDDEAVAGAVAARPALARLLPTQPGQANAGRGPGYASAADDEAGRVYAEQDLGQLQLFDAVLGTLAELSTHRPVLLILEDLHWADRSTRNLVSFLLSRLADQRLLVVGSYREEDVHRRHPLRGLLAELVRLPAVERVELSAFTSHDARAFVAALADAPLPEHVMDSVVSRSQGNPFFVEELLASGTDCEATDLPSGLAEVLLARLERLASDTRSVLRAVAVASEAVSHAALAEVCGLDELRLEEALREAVQHHVLVVERGCYLFRHALQREAVYGDLLPGERVRMHAAYASRLRSAPQERGAEAKLAYHSLESKDFATALDALLRAADEADKIGAPGAGLRHVEQALEIWAAVPPRQRPGDRDELGLLLQASYFAGTSGEPERAIAFARSAVDSLGPQVAPRRAAMVWRRLAEALVVLDSTFTEAEEAIARAWELIADAEPSADRAWVFATRAQILRGMERFDEAAASARTAVADGRASGAAAPEASALATLGTLADADGDAEQARRLLAEAARKAQAAGAVGTELRARYFSALSHDDHADLVPAMELYRRVAERAKESGLLWSTYGVAARSRLVSLRYLSGDWPEESEPDRPGSVVSGAVAAVLSCPWSHLAVARGRFAEAERLIAELRGQWRHDIWVALAASTAGTELAFWRGEYRRAALTAEEGVGWLERLYALGLAGVRVATLGAEACVVWLADARSRGDSAAEAEAAGMGARLVELARGCASRGRPRSGTLGPEGQAWLARLEAVAGELPGGAADPALWAKASEAFGYGAVYDQAMCDWQHARSLLAEGEPVAAARSLRRAHEVAGKLGAEPLRHAVETLARRARINLVDQPVRRDQGRGPLTEREHAVLERVALGRTNRQVGEELYISEKTVSVHLSRAMAKLGAARRAEAVAIAYDRGLLNPR